MRLRSDLLVRRLPGVVLACVPPPGYADLATVVRIEGTALAVFAELGREQTLEDLAASLARSFDAPPEQVAADLAPVLAGWRDAGLLTDAP